MADARLYQLIRQRDRIIDRTFEIAFLDPGAQAYVFTFGLQAKGYQVTAPQFCVDGPR